MRFFEKFADKIGFISKKSAAQQISKQRMFSAAQINRLTSGWAQSITSVDQDIFRSLRIMRARSRELSYNNHYVSKFLKLCKVNVVGSQGLKLQMRAKDPDGKLDKRANQIIEEAWQKWAKKGTCDVTGKLSWVDIQKLVIESVARDGEVLVRKVRNWKNSFRFALQIIEADHLDETYNEDLGSGNYIRMGVEFDAWDRPVAYHILTKHPGDFLQNGTQRNRERLPAEDIVHIFDSIRPRQSRGIPWMHAAMFKLNMLGGYEEAELVAARSEASKMGFFERTEDGESYEGDDEEEGEFITEAEPGTFSILPTGVKLTQWDPQHPAGNFGVFIKSALRGIASGLGCSYNSLANDLEGVNYSSLRHGNLEERDHWMIIQHWFSESLPDQIFPDWLQFAMLTGEVSLPFSKFDKFNSSTWMPRRWPWVDPLKESQANLISAGMGTKDLTDIIREQGQDPDELFERIQKTHETLKGLGLSSITDFIFKIKEESGDAGKQDDQED